MEKYEFDEFLKDYTEIIKRFQILGERELEIFSKFWDFIKFYEEYRKEILDLNIQENSSIDNFTKNLDEIKKISLSSKEILEAIKENEWMKDIPAIIGILGVRKETLFMAISSFLANMGENGLEVSIGGFVFNLKAISELERINKNWLLIKKEENKSKIFSWMKRLKRILIEYLKRLELLEANFNSEFKKLKKLKKYNYIEERRYIFFKDILKKLTYNKSFYDIEEDTLEKIFEKFNLLKNMCEFEFISLEKATENMELPLNQIKFQENNGETYIKILNLEKANFYIKEVEDKLFVDFPVWMRKK